MITVQEADFSHAELYQSLRVGPSNGAIVTFTGLVREFLEDKQAQDLIIEHFPGMVEKVIENYIKQAQSRWQIQSIKIVHRVGQLAPGDQIVFVGVSSAHRHDAFQAAQFLMDKLKTEAPFWKRENQQWVEAKVSDQEASSHWDGESLKLTK